MYYIIILYIYLYAYLHNKDQLSTYLLYLYSYKCSRIKRQLVPT